MNNFWETQQGEASIFILYAVGLWLLMILLLVIGALVYRFIYTIMVHIDLKRVKKLYKGKNVDLKYKFEYFDPIPNIMRETLYEALKMKENYKHENLNYGWNRQYNYSIFKDKYGKLKVYFSDGLAWYLTKEDSKTGTRVIKRGIVG
jgi:hypothetical protein